MPKNVLRVLKKGIKFCLPLRSKGLDNVAMARKEGWKVDPRFRKRSIHGCVRALKGGGRDRVHGVNPGVVLSFLNENYVRLQFLDLSLTF